MQPAGDAVGDRGAVRQVAAVGHHVGRAEHGERVRHRHRQRSGLTGGEELVHHGEPAGRVGVGAGQDADHRAGDAVLLHVRELVARRRGDPASDQRERSVRFIQSAECPGQVGAMSDRVQPAEPVIPAAQISLGEPPPGERGVPAVFDNAVVHDGGQDQRRERSRLNLRMPEPRHHGVTQGDKPIVQLAAPDQGDQFRVRLLVAHRRIGRREARDEVLDAGGHQNSVSSSRSMPRSLS
jgi:hypothetical protein